MNISEALDNLALAATNNRTIMQQLVEENQKLAEQLETVTAAVKKLTETKATTAASTKIVRPPMDPTRYCWTYGYHVNTNHTSQTCNYKADGHKNEATCVNPLDRSTRNKTSST